MTQNCDLEKGKVIKEIKKRKKNPVFCPLGESYICCQEVVRKDSGQTPSLRDVHCRGRRAHGGTAAALGRSEQVEDLEPGLCVFDAVTSQVREEGWELDEQANGRVISH